MTSRSLKWLMLTSLVLLASGCSHEHADHAPAEGKKSCCSADAPAAAGIESLPDTSLYLLDTVWSDQTGAARHLEDFRGEVVVTAMIFTHCEYACPRIVADLELIEEGIPEERRDGVRFLLVSMDSARDTPEVLAAYAKQRGLDSTRWTLLHGDEHAVRGLAATLGVRYKRDEQGNFAHSNLITVLHRDGRIAHQLEGLGADVTDSVSTVLSCLAEPE